VIDTQSNPESASYVDAKGLRHVLIEHIQTMELYVPNDITLAKMDSYTGMLLYGTNAVGKTSFIRALGIAIIMAQSGMYVPCSAFTYRPYRVIFTRILGNDNLFKNLSMFAVEMSELRVILNAADKYSLVLGDELCSGTETESALSIFVSGLTDLHQKCATFLFATHFHEILKFDEIKALKNIAVRHMAVHYDRESDCLIYDRVLREGAGNRLYGLEVAKSLHLPDEFIERAYQIRNKYFPDMRGDLSAPSTKYNSAKVRGSCELCKEELAEEIHHLQEQHLADDNGRIGSIHKNHPANLMGLCGKCHQLMHQIDSPEPAQPSIAKPKIIRKKTTKGYVVVADANILDVKNT
jgi:DNA mismatch repair protein MutS